jgi:hypothetical protein
MAVGRLGASLIALATCLIGDGCGREQGPAVSVLPRQRVGYVYLAPLLAGHPLYGQLRQLDREIFALAAPRPRRTAPPALAALEELVVNAPEGAAYPRTQLAQRRADWELGPSLLPGPNVWYLAPDLLTELNWTRRSLTLGTADEAARQRSEEEAGLSRLRAAAVRERQEQSNNAGLDLSLSDDEAQAAAAEKRQELQQEVEALMATERAAAEARLRTLREAWEREAAGQLAAKQGEVWARQQARSQTTAKSGSEIRGSMSKAMSEPEPLYFDGPMTWGGAVRQDAQTTRGRAESTAIADRRGRQAAVLRARRGQLRRDLYEDTRVTVAGLAAMQGWVVRFPPLQPAEGEDLTATVRTMLRSLYANE